MPLSPRRVTDTYAVQGQLDVADFSAAKALGFQSIVNNRPDGEEPGQPEADMLAKAAMDAGMNYVHIPISGPITPAQRDTMKKALTTLPPPVLAFCRSGARSTRIWAHAMQGEKAMAEIIQAAAQVGCNVVALAAELEQQQENPHE